MRALIAASLCLFAVLPVAQAATVQVSSHGLAFTNVNKATSDGSSTVSFSSLGTATSSVIVSPFGIGT